VDDVVIDKWIEEVEAGGRNWPACARHLAEYGHGKPLQSLDVTARQASSVDELTNAELAAIAGVALPAALGGAIDGGVIDGGVIDATDDTIKVASPEPKQLAAPKPETESK